jgi:hypothetical protein
MLAATTARGGSFGIVASVSAHSHMDRVTMFDR